MFPDFDCFGFMFHLETMIFDFFVGFIKKVLSQVLELEKIRPILVETPELKARLLVLRERLEFNPLSAKPSFQL